MGPDIWYYYSPPRLVPGIVVCVILAVLFPLESERSSESQPPHAIGSMVFHYCVCDIVGSTCVFLSRGSVVDCFSFLYGILYPGTFRPDSIGPHQRGCKIKGANPQHPYYLPYRITRPNAMGIGEGSSGGI